MAFQNGLSPLSQCSSLAHLERLGAIQEGMCQGIGAFLNEEQAHLLEINFFNIDKDPLTVAAVAAFVHLLDEFAWGILPENNLPEIMCNYGAQISAAVSGKHHRLPIYRETLTRSGEISRTIGNRTRTTKRLINISISIKGGFIAEKLH